MIRLKKISCFTILLFLACTLLFNNSLLAASQGETNKIKSQLAFGNPDSSIEIYFISDWFCPSCKKFEPKIESLYPKIQSKVAFYFVDFPINRESSNFTPYHLAFLVHEKDKDKYFDARRALLELTKKTKEPTDEDIVKATKQYGIDFKELSFAEVKNGTQFFDGIVKRYKLNSTPTLIIVNTKTDKFEKLTGSQINEKKILEELKQLES